MADDDQGATGVGDEAGTAPPTDGEAGQGREAAVSAAAKLLAADDDATGDPVPPGVDDPAAAAEAAAVASKADSAKASHQQEARRWARQARRERELSQTAATEAKRDLAEAKKIRADQQAWEEALKRNPMAAISGKLGTTPEQLLGMYADGKSDEVPPHVQAQLDALRGELEKERAGRVEREEAAVKERHSASTAQARTDDVAYLVAASRDADRAAKYPYWASIPEAEQQQRAGAMVDRAVALINNGESLTRTDVLEALDEDAKAAYDGFMASKHIAAGQGQPAPQTPLPATPVAPSAHDGAAPATRADLTDDDRRNLAAALATKMMAQDD